MKGKTKISFSALTLIAAAALAACGGNESKKSNNPTDNSGNGSSQAPSKVEVLWWTNYKIPNTDDYSKTDYAQYDFAMNAIKGYRAEHPNVTITMEYGGSYTELANKVDSGIATGNIPDMVLTYGTYVNPWIKAGVVADVTSKGEALEKDADFLKSYLDVEKAQYGGTKYYSLPYSKSADAFFYDKTMFAEKNYTVPTNFADMMALARKIKTDYPSIYGTQKDSDGNFTAVPVIYEGNANLFLTALESAGIKYCTADEDPAKAVKFNTQAAKDVMIQLKKWNNEGLIATKNQLYVSGQYHAYPSALFTVRKNAMLMSSTTGVRWLATYPTNKDGSVNENNFAMGTAELPAWKSEAAGAALGQIRSLSQGPSIAFFKKKDTAKLDAALDFYDYLTSTTNSAQLAKQTAYFPLRASSYADADIAANLAASKKGVQASDSFADKVSAYNGDVFNLNTTYASKNEYFMNPVFSLSGKARTAIGNMVDAVLGDKEATTDEQIAKLVNDEFATAYSAIFA